jgi:hypothetical protein
VKVRFMRLTFHRPPPPDFGNRSKPKTRRYGARLLSIIGGHPRRSANERDDQRLLSSREDGDGGVSRVGRQAKCGDT